MRSPRSDSRPRSSRPSSRSSAHPSSACAASADPDMGPRARLARLALFALVLQAAVGHAQDWSANRPDLPDISTHFSAGSAPSHTNSMVMTARRYGGSNYANSTLQAAGLFKRSNPGVGTGTIGWTLYEPDRVRRYVDGSAGLKQSRWTYLSL